MSDELTEQDESNRSIPQDEEDESRSNRSDNDSRPNAVFTLQASLGSGGGDVQHHHFHHHAFHRHNTSSDNTPVRFKDARAREQAEKLRERLRERQLGAASADIPEAFIVPCTGNCGTTHTQQRTEQLESSSSEDAADEVLQRLISTIADLKVENVTSTSALVSWDDIEIEGCHYQLFLIEGKVQSVTKDVEPPYKLESLKPGTHYGVRIQAKVSTILGDPSTPYYFQTISTEPSQPDPPRQGASAKSWLQVKWNPVSANGSPIIHYLLSWDQGTDNWTELCKCTERQYKVTGLKPGTKYSFRVAALNDIGESLKSDIGVCSTSVGVPGPPTCIYLGQSSETSLKICWSRPSEDGGTEVDSYTVEQETEYGFMTVYDGDQKECTINDLLRSTNYRFRVFSSNIAGRSKPSVAVTFTTRAGLPPPPINVRLEGKERTDGVILGWDAPQLEGEQEILRYNIKVTPVKCEDPTTQSFDYHTLSECRYVVSGLEPGTLYRALITLVTQGGEGPACQPFIFKTRPVHPLAPNPPSLRTRPGSSSLSLQWSEPSYNGGSPISKYALEMYTDIWDKVYTGSDSAYVVGGLKPGKIYKFRLRCFNSAGPSLYSNSVIHQTGPAVPTRPQNLFISSRGPHSADFSWNPSDGNGSPVISYSLELCKVGEKFREVYCGSDLLCTLKDLSAGVSYIATVKAQNVVGYGIPSEPVAYTSPPSPPAVISKIFVESNSDTSIEVSWDEPDSTGSDLLYYNVCFNGEIYKVKECSFTAENLNSATTYKVRVQAVNTIGAGPFTSIFNVSTKLPPPPQIPGSIVVQNTGHNFLKVSWSSIRNIKQYCVERKSKFDAAFVEVYNGNKNYVKMSKLLASTEYEVRVAAVNDAGVGPWIYGTFKTEAMPPQTILKFSSSLDDRNISLSWSVKDRLRDTETFELYESVGRGGTFGRIYEGVEMMHKSFISILDTLYQYKVRIKRDEGGDGSALEYGPFSQTISINIKSKPTANLKLEKREASCLETVDETENDEKKLIFMIFGSLCIPALLIIIYIMYGNY